MIKSYLPEDCLLESLPKMLKSFSFSGLSGRNLRYLGDVCGPTLETLRFIIDFDIDEMDVKHLLSSLIRFVCKDGLKNYISHQTIYLEIFEKTGIRRFFGKI